MGRRWCSTKVGLGKPYPMKNTFSFDDTKEAWRCILELLNAGKDISIYQGKAKIYVSVIFTPE